ncbi:MAG: helix-turn-helix domain-containing protein [Pseudomonadota bacterium]|nr:helix-turn-helix domain-containing protein [Pseudomonadota bacterium]MEE3101540.1 helix-turn-helix domain-containing protein [Pseudomonadota bacterium]
MPDRPAPAPAETLGSKERRRRDSDRRMLRAAAALIGRHGVGGTTLGMIGVEAGYSRGLPTQRFGTKIALLEAVLDAMERRFLRVAERQTAGLKGCEALAERIRLQVISVHEMPDSVTALYHMIVDSIGAEPELHPRVLALHQVYHDNLRGHLIEARALEELRDDVDIDRAARLISGAISGACIQALVYGDTARLVADADMLAETFLCRIARPGVMERVAARPAPPDAGAGG